MNTERRIQRLHDENNDLRLQRESDGKGGGGGGDVGSHDYISLQRDLRNKNAQLSLAQTRYEHLEEKTKAQREIQERTLSRLDEYNRTLRDLRSA